MPVAGTLELADLAVFAVMLVIVAALWILLQARGPVGSLPVIGAPGVNLIDGMRKTITDWATNIESFLTWQQSQATQLWASFVSGVMAPALNAIDTAAAHEAAFLLALFRQENGLVKLGLGQVQAELARSIVPALSGLEAAVATDERYARQVLAAGLAATTHELGQAEGVIEDTRARLAYTEQQLADVRATLSVLVSYLPVIQGLAGFEAGAAGGIGAIQRDLADQRGRVQVNTDQLAKVLALAGVAALGAAAIENLVRVARDPCSACSGTNMLDLEARLELVEVFGET